MLAFVGDPVGGLITGPDQFRMVVQQNGGLDFTGVHVAVRGCQDTGFSSCRFPVGRAGEQSHSDAAAGGLLNHVAQYVIPAVPIDQYEAFDTGPAE
ncbi:hypothetical protein GCM10010393_33840 [Streptomyces gobitricini]|uniref:Uncharacterized protein n=1 Tax=Streptomyces gobitricini TaxID=68211 RepID=A0ABN3MDC6_9ACTN